MRVGGLFFVLCKKEEKMRQENIFFIPLRWCLTILLLITKSRNMKNSEKDFVRALKVVRGELEKRSVNEGMYGRRAYKRGLTADAY